MLKILVVDDEKPIRQWFKFFLEKYNDNYKIIGEAQNGEEALRIFLENKPDIIFTDIKMPVMDGIELIKKVKLIEPNINIIILTCYSEFIYAREAIKYGVMGYVLKAEVDEEDIIKILKSINLNKSNKKVNTTDIGIQLEKDLIFKDILELNQNDKEIESNFIKNNILLDSENLFAVSFYYNKLENINKISILIRNLKAANLKHFYCFRYDGKYLVLVINLKNINSEKKKIEIVNLLTDKIYKIVNTTLGVSNILNNFSNIKTICNQAIYSLKLDFYIDKEIILYKNINCQSQFNNNILDTFKNEAVYLLKQQNFVELENKFYEILKSFNYSYCDKQKVIDFCKEIFAMIRLENIHNAGRINYNDLDLKEITSIQTYSELETMMKEKIRKLNIAYNNMNIKNYSSTVRKILKYIDENYNKRISLDNLADFIELNPNYLSKLFKDETGENFSNYLTAIRLKEAEKLLKNTNYKVYEIASLIGYPSLSYFSRIFKKHYGKSPFEYKITN